MHLISFGRLFHSFIAVNAKLLGDKESSRESWKLCELPRVLWLCNFEIEVKLGKRYLGASPWRIRKRCDILKVVTRLGIVSQDKSSRLL